MGLFRGEGKPIWLSPTETPKTAPEILCAQAGQHGLPHREALWVPVGRVADKIGLMFLQAKTLSEPPLESNVQHENFRYLQTAICIFPMSHCHGFQCRSCIGEHGPNRGPVVGFHGEGTSMRTMVPFLGYVTHIPKSCFRGKGGKRTTQGKREVTSRRGKLRSDQPRRSDELLGA